MHCPTVSWQAIVLTTVAAVSNVLPWDIGRAFAQTTPSSNTESPSVDESDPPSSDVVSLIAGIRDAHRRGDDNLRYQLTDDLGKRGQEAIPALINLLDFESAIVRGQAASFLGKQGRRSTPALPSLIRCLSDNDRQVYGAAARAILAIKSQEGPVFLADIVDNQHKDLRLETARLIDAYSYAYPHQCWQALCHLFEDRDADVRQQAFKGLARLTPKPRSGQVSELMTEVLHDSSPQIREAGIIWLKEMAYQLDSSLVNKWLADAFDDDSAGVRLAAAEAAFQLSRLTDETARCLEGLVQIQDNASSMTRTRGFVLLGNMGANAVPSLIRLIDAKNDSYVRLTSIHVLGRLQSRARLAVPALVKCLEDEAIRLDVLRALGDIGPAASSAVPRLVSLLADERIRGDTLMTLDRIGPAAKAAVPELVNLIEDSNFGGQAIFTLGQIGPGAGAAAPALTKLFRESDDTSLRLAVVQTLGQIGKASSAAAPDIVTFALRDLEREPYGFTYKTCATALIGIGEAAVKPLLDFVRDGNADHRLAAVQILRQLGPTAKSAVPVLVALLSDDDERVQKAAVHALIAIDFHAEPLLAVLIDLPEAGTKPNSKGLLLLKAFYMQSEGLGPNDERVVAMLIEHLRSDSKVIRLMAAVLLGKIGPAAKQSLPALQAASEMKDAWNGEMARFVMISKVRSFILGPAIVYARALRSIGGNEAALPVLLRMAGDQTIAGLLQKEDIEPFLDDESLERLREASNDPDTETRSAAALILRIAGEAE